MHIDKLLKHSRRVEIDDLDWDQAAAIGLTDEEAEVLTYFADVEGQTVYYLRELLLTNVAMDPEVVAFLTMWNYEEFFHAEALARVMKVSGRALDKQRKSDVRVGARVSAKVEEIAQTLLSKLFPSAFPTLSMTWGASQELLTLRGYEQISRTTANPVLAELCRRIAKQERRHFAWYYNTARKRLAQSAVARRLTRFVFERFWSPVGSGVKRDTEVARMCSSLFPAGTFVEVATGIDARLARLPGMEGLEVISSYARRLTVEPKNNNRQLVASKGAELAPARATLDEALQAQRVAVGQGATLGQ